MLQDSFKNDFELSFEHSFLKTEETDNYRLITVSQNEQENWNQENVNVSQWLYQNSVKKEEIFLKEKLQHSISSTKQKSQKKLKENDKLKIKEKSMKIKVDYIPMKNLEIENQQLLQRIQKLKERIEINKNASKVQIEVRKIQERKQQLINKPNNIKINIISKEISNNKQIIRNLNQEKENLQNYQQKLDSVSTISNIKNQKFIYLEKIKKLQQENNWQEQINKKTGILLLGKTSQNDKRNSIKYSILELSNIQQKIKQEESRLAKLKEEYRKSQEIQSQQINYKSQADFYSLKSQNFDIQKLDQFQQQNTQQTETNQDNFCLQNQQINLTLKNNQKLKVSQLRKSNTNPVDSFNSQKTNKILRLPKIQNQQNNYQQIQEKTEKATTKQEIQLQDSMDSLDSILKMKNSSKKELQEECKNQDNHQRNEEQMSQQMIQPNNDKINQEQKTCEFVDQKEEIKQNSIEEILFEDKNDDFEFLN